MTYLITFLEGIITFVSPCLLPMIPIYVTYFAAGEEVRTSVVLRNALGFALGFTCVFIAMGALASSVGAFFIEYQSAVNVVCGLVVIAFGLYFLGIIKINLFHGAKNPLAGRQLGFFSSVLFGVIFWDYSGFKFNLGGRVNLLYCFFWGIAAVVWIRYGYPLVARLMANLKKHILPWMTVVLTVFMAVNMGLSALALARYDARTSGLAPANQLDVFLDEHFDNARMERVYPNAKKTG